MTTSNTENNSVITHASTIVKKRKQVSVACVNCQKSCKKCEEERPCPRCVKMGFPEKCVDSVRKPRQKGIKRGPYKKRSTAVAPPQPMPPPSHSVMYSMPSGDAATATTTFPFEHYGTNTEFAPFPGFQQGAPPYVQYKYILNNMNTIIQAANSINNPDCANAEDASSENKDNENNNGIDKTKEEQIEASNDTKTEEIKAADNNGSGTNDGDADDGSQYGTPGSTAEGEMATDDGDKE
ncbi:hypothetical protein BC941DRAFT_419143 [Chlamydoabsidia padenii]|nr:hypothetical protein BC941DRAFT_419143 [Chlamydoabsidia padenii]